MARPPSIRDEDILEAARAVFLERGIRATTADVAARAGVSEGSIFKRWKTKEELFHGAMRVDELAGHAAERALSVLEPGRRDVREQLYDLALELIGMFRAIMPAMMMSWSNRDETFARLQRDDSPPLRMYGRVMAYLSAEIAEGRLAPVDVEIITRCLLGSIQNYVFFETLMRARREEPTPADTFARRLVDALWTGIAPRRDG